MKLSIIINCDTRPDAGGDFHEIKNYGGGNLCGVHSHDFLTHGVVAKNRFLESHGVERETVLYVDLHDPIPGAVMTEIDYLIETGEITKLVTAKHSKAAHRWNDLIYCAALEHASGDFCAHWDGDCIGYRRPGFDVLKAYLAHLDAGCKYVCQQSPLNQGEHLMFWASTRFFVCRTKELDVPELRRLTDDAYRARKFHGLHLPCLEHFLGAMAGVGRVLYPPAQNRDFVVWSWVHYHRGAIEKLNAMTYDDVYKYVFEACGGPLGASDLMGKPL